MSNTIRQSGVFRGESQNDPSRSNSLMSENSSQPDMHPFYKVRSEWILGKRYFAKLEVKLKSKFWHFKNLFFISY